MGEKLTVAQVGARLGQERGKEKGLSKVYVLQLIHSKRLAATQNEFNFYLVEPEELDRFIQEDFNQSKPRGRNARKLREQNENS